MGQNGTKKGFTLIELSFAIAFISILLITVTLITNEVVSIYRKGYSIKSVNQVGRDLIDDFQSSIIESPPSAIDSFCSLKYSEDARGNCESNNGFYSVYQQFYLNDVHVLNSDEGAKTVPIGGIFCSGKYTYIWNTGYVFNKDGYYYTGSDSNRKDLASSDYRLSLSYHLVGESVNKTLRDFRLVKIEDTSREICAKTLTTANGYPATNVFLKSPGSVNQMRGNNVITLENALSEDPVDMLKDNDTSLALFDLVIFEPARVSITDRLLFSGSFILGTTTGGIDIMTSDNYCKAPSNFSADFSYCAINKFNFTIQASGG